MITELSTRQARAPAAVVQKVRLDDHRTIGVVREDLLPGGTKQRACLPYLESLLDLDIEEVIYASPFCGYAQVALAYCASQLGLRCTLFCERQSDGTLHEFTARAQKYGAKIISAATLPSAQSAAEIYSRKQSGSHLVPLGMDCLPFKQEFARQLKTEWLRIADSHRLAPRRLWLPVGSGTLARTFKSFLPTEVEVMGVDVHVLPERDPRISTLSALGVRIFSAPMPFKDRASVLPPLPSNTHYDAKLWAVLVHEAKSGDLWWNVGP